MLRTLNKVSGFAVGAVLYPLKSLLVNLFNAAATILIASLIFIIAPIYAAVKTYENDSDKKLSSALFWGIVTAFLAAFALTLITSLVLVVISVATIHDLFQSIRLGAEEGYKKGLFYHILNRALNNSLMFSIFLKTVYRHLFEINGLDDDQLAELCEGVDIDVDYRITDPSHLLSSKEINDAKEIVELGQTVAAYEDLIKTLMQCDKAILKRGEEQPERINAAVENLNKFLIFVYQNHNDLHSTLTGHIDVFRSYFTDPDKKPSTPEQTNEEVDGAALTRLEKNLDELSDLLASRACSQNFARVLELFLQITENDFHSLAQRVRSDFLDYELVQDNLLQTQVVNPSLMVKLYQYQEKWRPIPNETRIIDFAQHESLLKKNAIHPRTREHLLKTVDYVVDGISYPTIYRIFPYKDLNSSHELKSHIVTIRKKLASLAPVQVDEPIPKEKAPQNPPSILDTLANRFFGNCFSRAPTPQSELERTDTSTFGPPM
ncbi:hypothetical protein [Legionella hackeliae]|uniref:Coiled coil protein n=1 Tax=Legionella hackeliae TaxID=449 RepID=A0A0A8URY4_LEGHA|nr:hypothetical protein [Legionella hackeliae]KTD08853.1 hypothetical protein Lhac_3076 [Legionella hackeliae]CEK10281.1 protein of unknown function [Legionella hackeliae]STX47011.1 Uncharacterised protein [Legionella hackeliae]